MSDIEEMSDTIEELKEEVTAITQQLAEAQANCAVISDIAMLVWEQCYNAHDFIQGTPAKELLEKLKRALDGNPALGLPTPSQFLIEELATLKARNEKLERVRKAARNETLQRVKRASIKRYYTDELQAALDASEIEVPRVHPYGPEEV